jgi:hypothetical protein
MNKQLRKTIARMKRAKRKAGAPKDEWDYFQICDECGQAFDTRSAAQVFHHEELDHQPLTESELTELSLIERAWSKTAAARSRKGAP